MKEAEEVKAPYKEPDERTTRMVKAIGKDDFEECEDAIMQGADVNADCGAGMCALHISAIRGEIFLTELLLAHGANINQRDMAGNTPLLYACHFYRQNGRGVQLCAQLLFHKADPHFRVKDGALAGKSALDMMEKACNEPNTDEKVPINMKAMLQLALDGSEAGLEAITKMWVSIKSEPQNKKLFQVSSKKDNFDYAMKSIDWELPDELKNSGYAPVKLDVPSDCILEEKFTVLKDYLFNDEGDKVKVYVTFPESVPVDSLGKENLDVSFEYQAFDLKLRTSKESFRLRIEPLFGSIEVDQCKHRASQSSRKASTEGPMETVILEKTIIKLGSLLALGFGEAGANIISHNMKGSDSAGVNAILPGMKVDCVIGLCRVLDFGTATEVLQGRIMTFVNQIAEIIHGVVDEFHGVPTGLCFYHMLQYWGSGLHSGSAISFSSSSASGFCTVKRNQHSSSQWMSLQSLVSELQSLRRDLSELSARVLALENQVTSTTEARFTTPPASPLVINYTGLSSPIPQSPYPETGSAAAELPSFPTSSVATPATGASGGTNLTEAERVQLARDAGGFLRLCLTGEQRGTSGRDRLRLSSKVYVLFRDIQGTLHNPASIGLQMRADLEEEVEEPRQEEVPETPAALPIRSCLALVGPELALDEEFPVGQFELPASDLTGTGPSTVSIVAIAEADDKGTSQWTANLILRRPKFGWGCLPFAEEFIHFDRTGDSEPPDFPFSATDVTLIPSGASLASAYQQHFSYLTANSGSASGGVRAKPDPSGLDRRLEALEQSVQSIAKSVQQLTSSGPAAAPALSSAACAPPPGLVLPPKPRAESAQQTPARGTQDYDMVASARQAGVPEQQIQEMLRLAMKGRARLPDFPASSKVPGRKNILSESEDEEEEATAAAVSGLASGDPVASALEKLTQIASHLTIDKKKSKTLEALLDGVGLGDATSSSASSGSRRHAAALRALRNALTRQPEEIARAIEKNMEEDFFKVSQMPGSSPVNVTARAWLELRSRVQGYQTPAVFTDIQRCDYGIAFKLSSETVDELWTLVGLCPLFVADLRAEVGQELALVDASGEWEAEVSTQVSGQLAHELSRQKLTKAAWSRLLTPFQARQRLHGLLQPSEEVPEGEQPAANHPLWTMTVKSHQFSLRWRKKTRRRAHINVSELSAALRSEARRCRKFPNHRHLLGSDSQVTLGALVRGRSSSRSLNRHLKQSLPVLLAYNGYTNAQYIPTLINTADDPTRNKSCRPAELPEPVWLAEAAAGRFGPLDEVLEKHGIDDAAIARWPTSDAGEDAASNTGRPADIAEDEGDCGALHSEGALPSLAPMPSEPGSCTAALQPGRALPSLAPMSLEHSPCTASLQPERALPSLAPMASQQGSCTDALQAGRALPSLSPMVSQHGSCTATLQPGQALPSLAPMASQHSSCTPALQPGRALPSLAQQQVRTGRDHRRRKPPVATSPVFEPWLPRRRLDAAALALLTALPRSQFVVPRGLKLDDILAKPGHLDLFSGCRVAAQELANRSGRWVLTYDIEHSHLEDLLSPQVQFDIERMLHHKCFLSVTAGPVCSSFSRAVRPAVRSSLHPEGLNNISESMKSKIAIGNSMSQWVAKVVNICLQLRLPFWIENPSGSYLWQQREWADIIRSTPSFVTDYCRWGTPWRKRTRFLGMFSPGGKRCMCQCSRPHLRLTGYSAEYKCSWTKAAQAYPRPLAVFLAKALIESLKPITRQRSLDPSACARCGHRRIGEAANPGPRPRGVRPAVDLEQVQLVQPTTQAIQLRAQRLFLDWLERELSVEAWTSVRGAPQLQVLFLRSFGNWLFNQGMPMYLFRHLVVLIQQQFPAERHQITSAWDLLARWELVQPVSHRPPLPKILLDAFVCLALSWGWASWNLTLS
eukprot:symbB.v1.2.009108.t1/scaffold573.1/size222803/17